MLWMVKHKLIYIKHLADSISFACVIKYGDVKVSTGVLKDDKRVEERTLLKRRTF